MFKFAHYIDVEGQKKSSIHRLDAISPVRNSDSGAQCFQKRVKLLP